MYNLNVNLAATAASAVNSLLSVESACTTPRTPEILNSLIAMTNPLDNYPFGDEAHKKTHAHISSMSSDSNSSSCSQLESPSHAPPSVQHTCSQLIKAGLKLSIEQKRKLQSDGDDLLDLDKCKRIKRNESESEEDKVNVNGLTPEDEERRRRRRERNKIAATKCRLKKRERTANLVTESETLETQNIEYKSQIQELERTRLHLVDMLTLHRPHCQKNIAAAPREHDFSRLPPVSCVIETNHSYNRPASASSSSYQTHGVDVYNRPPSVHYMKRPTIIVESPADSYEPQLTNLDESGPDSFAFNSQQCHNYSSSQGYGSAGMDNGCMA